MTQERSFVVVPFKRVGSYVGAQQMLMVKDAGQAHALLQKLARQFPGVAVIERRVDEETGADVDTLVQTCGAVPRDIPNTTNWTMALH